MSSHPISRASQYAAPLMSQSANGEEMTFYGLGHPAPTIAVSAFSRSHKGKSRAALGKTACADGCSATAKLLAERLQRLKADINTQRTDRAGAWRRGAETLAIRSRHESGLSISVCHTKRAFRATVLSYGLKPIEKPDPETSFATLYGDALEKQITARRRHGNGDDDSGGYLSEPADMYSEEWYDDETSEAEDHTVKGSIQSRPPNGHGMTRDGPAVEAP